MVQLVHSFAGLLVCALLAQPAVAATPDSSVPVVQPSAAWVVDWNETRCMAARTYKDSDDKDLTIAIKASAKSGSYQIYLMRPGSYLSGTARVRPVRFGTASEEQVSFLDYGRDNIRALLTMLDAGQAERLKASSSITVDAGRDVREYVLGSMTQVAAALEECRVDLARTWNGDPATRRLAKRATGNLLPLFRVNDYPRQAMTEGSTGTVEFLLLIDEQGKVADCTVQRTSGYAALDVQSCGIISERARFKPAIGLDGKPARDVHSQRVTWILPGQ